MSFDKERLDYIEAQPEVLEQLAVHRKRHEEIRCLLYTSDAADE